MTLVAVILAGGSGTRFWPRSRRAKPKQFLNLGSSRTLLQETFDRVDRLVTPERTLVVVNQDYAALVREQLPSVATANVLLEPSPKDTAAAIGYAAAVASARFGEDACLAVLPSDHRITPTDRFQAALEEARSLATSRPDVIVTLGIRPTRPATGFGYMERGAPVSAKGAFPAFAVRAFREKPALDVATLYLEKGGFSWNAGIFVFTAKTILAALERLLPDTCARVQRIAAAAGHPDAKAVLAREWQNLAKISIDFAVLEKSRDAIVMLDVDFDWSDVGSWDAAATLFETDSKGNAFDGVTLVAEDASRCIVAGDGRLVALLGVKDVVVVQAGDTTLVCDRSRVEDVKKLMAELERRGLSRHL